MSQTHRPNIRQKSISGGKNGVPWKDSLKQKCLDRVRQRRTRRFEEMRNARTVTLNRHGQIDLDDSIDSEVGHEEPTQRTSARDLLNEQLMEESLHLRVCSTPQHHLSADNTGTTPTSSGERMLFFSPVSTNTNIEDVDDMYCMTEEELFTLMKELDEEIQKEEDYLAEEFELMQKREEMEEMLLLEQIESFDRLEIGGTLDSLNTTEVHLHSIPCPACQLGRLSKNSESGRIYCSAESCPLSHTNSSHSLEFGVDMNIETLKQELGALYENHASICHGLLRFQLGNLDGHNGLLVICSLCQRMELVAICI